MQRLKKLCALALCLSVAALTGCGARDVKEDEAQTLNVYASFYPIYALTEMIADGVPDLTLHQLVQPQDGCLRAYALSDWDAALLASADALIVGGEGLESFSGALEGASSLAVAQALSGVDLMEVEAENADPDADSHWEGANPHAYMSVDGALDMAEHIAGAMAVFDPRYEETYLANLAHTKETLEALRAEIADETIDIVNTKCAVLNEALTYTAQDCGLDAALYWARESGASMEDSELDRLLAAMEAKGVRLVLIERQAPQSLLEALKESGLSVAALDVLSTHRADEGSRAYLDALKNNAALVRAACEDISQEDS